MLKLPAASASEVDWQALYEEELPRIYNFFRYRIGDGPMAEDLAATTFEKAWRNRDRYQRNLGAFSTWLLTIARNVTTDYFRQRHDEIPLDDVRYQAGNTTPEELTEQRDESTRLFALLAKMPDRERELVALKYGAGRTNRDIAHITGLSESNVGTMLYRIVRTLRAEWEE